MYVYNHQCNAITICSVPVSGARAQSQSVLVTLQQVVESEEQLKAKRRELGSVEDEIRKLQHVATK